MIFINIIEIALIVIVFGSIIGFFVLHRKSQTLKESRQFQLPDQIPATGIRVPVLETTTGPKAFRKISFLENYFNPKLILYDTRMEYRVLISRSTDYSQITNIQAEPVLFLHRIWFSFLDRPFTFGAVFANANTVETITEFFRQRGIPIISKN